MLVAEIDLISRFFNFLMRSPSPSEVMNIKVSDAENQRFVELSEKKTSGTITFDEIQELGYFLKAEHLIRMAKIEAYGKLNGPRNE